MPFFVMFFLLIPLLLQGAEPDFYVWQRERDSAVKKAVRQYYATCSGKLYFLAGEMENDGKTVSFKPERYVDFSRSVPVVRIHIRHMRKSPRQLAGELAGLYQPWKRAGAFQIDLDAPESKIPYYQQLMKELRSRLPGVQLSATVLPCHLRHTKEFRGLAKACDFYVLQVHALSNDGTRWFILDKEIAFQALARAKALKLPFKTALPFYCNTVRGGIHVEPDMNIVGALAKESPEVIGFRLGVSNDEESLDLETALKVCRGEKYSPSIELARQDLPNGMRHYYIVNKGYFPKTVTLDCDWKKAVSYLDLGTFNGARFSHDRRKLTLRLPPSGNMKPFFWIRSKESENIQSITIQHRGNQCKKSVIFSARLP